MGVQRVQNTSTGTLVFPSLTPPLTMPVGSVAEIPDTITLAGTTVVSIGTPVTAGTATGGGTAYTPRLSGLSANRPSASAFGEGEWYNTDLARLDHSDGLTWTNGVGGGGGGTSVVFTDKGAWASTTAYVVGDTVTQGSVRYVCAVAHTAGTFATDLAAGKWDPTSVAAAIYLWTGTKVAAYTASSGQAVPCDPTQRIVTDGVRTNGSAAITSASALFTSTDVGRPITGTGIPNGTTILSVQSGTAATMSANATASATGATFTIGGSFPVTLPATAVDATVRVKNFSGVTNLTVVPPSGSTLDGSTAGVTLAPGDSMDASGISSTAWVRV